MNILFLSGWYPLPADNGSKIRIANLLRGLCRLHSVTLVSFFNPQDGTYDESRPFPGVRRVSVCRVQEFNPRSFRSKLGLLSPTPRHFIDTHSPEMEDLIRREMRGTKFDLVIASQFSMARYSHCFRGIPALFEEAELALYWPGASNAHSLRSRFRKWLTWVKHRRYLARVLRDFAACTVASEAEKKMLAAAVPAYGSVRVVPNSIDLRDYTGVSADRVPGSLFFAGSLRYGPNYDAVSWFLREIYPAIKAKLPQARLTVTGDPGDAPLPEGSDVVWTGRVADVRPLLAASAVSLAPIREGGGTRLKILESMAMRTPVVTTSKGMEGLTTRNAEHLLVADTPNEFAQAVTYLLRNPEAASKMAGNAFELVRSQYDSEVVLRDFLRLVEQTARCGSRLTRSAIRLETPRVRTSAAPSMTCEPAPRMRPTESADRF